MSLASTAPAKKTFIQDENGQNFFFTFKKFTYLIVCLKVCGDCRLSDKINTVIKLRVIDYLYYYSHYKTV